MAPRPLPPWGRPGAAAAAASTGEGPINKQVVSMEGPLYSYLLAHTREPEVLCALREATAAQFPAGARMQVSPEQGAFLAWLVQALAVRRVIEVGVFTGYSSVAMALALPPGGELLACDRDPAAMALARQYWALAGVADKARGGGGGGGRTAASRLEQPAILLPQPPHARELHQPTFLTPPGARPPSSSR